MPQELQKRLEIVHQARKEDFYKARILYGNTKSSFAINNFILDMAKELSIANLVIARSGASTVAELCASGKPSILIPYPYATDNHQKYNALEIADSNGCLVLEHNDLLLIVLLLFCKNY